MEDFQPSQEDEQKKYSEKELKAMAQRNLALGVLPAIVRAHPDFTPTRIVKRAYDIAKQMINQGEKL